MAPVAGEAGEITGARETVEGRLYHEEKTGGVGDAAGVGRAISEAERPSGSEQRRQA